MVHRRGLVDPVFLTVRAIIVNIEHTVIVVIFIDGFVKATVLVVVVPREGNPRIQIVGAIVIGDADAVAVLVRIAQVADEIVVKVRLCWIGHCRAIVSLVNEAIAVAVNVGTSVLFNVVFFVGNPANRAFWTQVVGVEDTVFVVVQILCQVSATVTVMVRKCVG